MRLRKNLKKSLSFVSTAMMLFGTVGSGEGYFVHAEEKAKTPEKYVYQYNENDPLYAATHFHLFAKEKIDTGSHTCGNVVTPLFKGQEIGSRDNQNKREVSYIRNEIEEINASSNFTGALYLGSEFKVVPKGGQTEIVKPNGNTIMMNKTGEHYCAEENGSYFIDIEKEFTKLETLSATLAKQSIASPNADVVVHLTDVDQNNCNIDFSKVDMTNAGFDCINVDYADWTSFSTKVDMLGLDSDTSHQGIVVINIDLKNYETSIDLSRGGLLAKARGNGSIKGNTETATEDYGTARILYNFYDSGEKDYIYRGDLLFNTGNGVIGSVLAPGADISIGAVNGTVIANKIKHNGGESHRRDIIPETDDNMVVIKNSEEEEISKTYEVTFSNEYDVTNEIVSGVKVSLTGETVDMSNVVPKNKETAKDFANENGTVSWTTTDKAVTLKNLPQGNYNYVQETILDGYKKTEAVDFSINSDGQIKIGNTVVDKIVIKDVIEDSQKEDSDKKDQDEEKEDSDKKNQDEEEDESDKKDQDEEKEDSNKEKSDPENEKRNNDNQDDNRSADNGASGKANDQAGNTGNNSVAENSNKTENTEKKIVDEDSSKTEKETVGENTSKTENTKQETVDKNTSKTENTKKGIVDKNTDKTENKVVDNDSNIENTEKATVDEDLNKKANIESKISDDVNKKDKLRNNDNDKKIYNGVSSVDIEDLNEKNIKTGDSYNLMLGVFGMLFSAIAYVILILYKIICDK